MNSRESGVIFGLLGFLAGVILAFAACSPAQDLTCPIVGVTVPSP